MFLHCTRDETPGIPVQPGPRLETPAPQPIAELGRSVTEGFRVADEEWSMGIRIAGNTMIPCLQAIVAKGYTVTHYFLGDRPGAWDRPQWDAEKDGRLFSATGPEELLGLIHMWEVRGDDWQLKPGESELYGRLVEAAPLYDAEGNVVDR